MSERAKYPEGPGKARDVHLEIPQRRRNLHPPPRQRARCPLGRLPAPSYRPSFSPKRAKSGIANGYNVPNLAGQTPGRS